MTEFWERCHFGLGGRICCVDEVTWMNTATEYKVQIVARSFAKAAWASNDSRTYRYTYPLKYKRNLHSLIKFGLQIDIAKKLLSLKRWLIKAAKSFW